MRFSTFILFILAIYVLLNSIVCGGKKKQGKKDKTKIVGETSGNVHAEQESNDLPISFNEYAKQNELSSHFPEDLRLKIIENSTNIENYDDMLINALIDKSSYSRDELALIIRELIQFKNYGIDANKSYKDEGQLENF
uniref:Fam-c protein n=1 Tax=Meloidogyne javanica TaxID=6303 RepID=A0A915LP39_MELJA